MNAKIVAGPWLGEFGWELMSWQGYLRKLSEAHEIVVSIPEGHSELYHDFAKNIIPHRLEGTRDCWWTTLSPTIPQFLAVQIELTKLGLEQLKPTRLYKLEEQKFIKYGNATRVPAEEQGLVIVHARGPIGKRPHHAWPERNWAELCTALDKLGVKMAAIGTQASLPPFCLDWRNKPMRFVMDRLAAAKLVLGPSSGPLHLASLCGARHLVWTDKQPYAAVGCTNRVRYESKWNPLGTPCTILDDMGWNPSPLRVTIVVKEALNA